MVRATRATRTRPRPESGSLSTALDRSSDAASVLRGSVDRRRPRAISTRSRTAAEASPGGAASSAARGRGIATARSKRSSSARESFSRYAASRCGVQAHSTAGSPRAPHGTHVHRADELEASREERMPTDARDRDDAVLERLAERLQHRAWKLGQLVEQQNAAMRERDLSGARSRSATDHGRSRRTVMRRAKRRHGDERALGRQKPAHRVDAGHLERLRPPERREDPGKPAGRASSSPSREGPSGEGCGLRRPRPRARDELVPARARPRDRERAPARAHRPGAGRIRGRRSHRGDTRRPRRDGERRSAPLRRARPRAPTRRRRRRAAARLAGLPRRPRALRRPVARVRRAPAHRPPRARRAARRGSASSRRGPPARSEGRTRIPPCAAPPARD